MAGPFIATAIVASVSGQPLVFPPAHGIGSGLEGDAVSDPVQPTATASRLAMDEALRIRTKKLARKASSA